MDMRKILTAKSILPDGPVAFIFRYFNPLYCEIQDFNSMTAEERAKVPSSEVPIKAITLHSRLSILVNFMNFLKEQYIFAGLTSNDIDAVQLRLSKLKTTLLVSQHSAFENMKKKNTIL